MANDDRPQAATRSGGRKWAMAAGVVVLVLVVAMILVVIFGGMQAANPWSEQPGPGP